MGFAGFGMLCMVVGLVQTIIKLITWLSWKRKGNLVTGELLGTEIADTTRKGDRITATRYRHTFLIRDDGQEYTCYYYEKVSGDASSSYKQGAKAEFLFDEKKEMIINPAELKAGLTLWGTILGAGAAMTAVGFLLFYAISSCK